MKTIRFTSTRLEEKGKKGILKPDEAGYYTLPLGGLNAFNSAGEYYTLNGAEELFKESAVLMRRLGKGYLKSELGHPKMLPTMTNKDFLARILAIEETNVSGHIKELWLDHEYGKRNPQFNNPKLVAVMGKVCPSGPHGDALKRSLDNPSENVGFSIRGLTKDYFERGQCYRILTTIVTFDQVVEQGINIPNKWDSEALESMKSSLFSLDHRVTESELAELVRRPALVATESSRELAREALRSVQESSLPVLPLFTRW